MPDVIVVGGGPTGLLLAGELRLAGADPLVLEARDGTTRWGHDLGLRGLNGRTTQTLRLRGLIEPLVRTQKAVFDRLVADRGGERTNMIRGLTRMLQENRASGHFSGLPLVEDQPDPSGAADQFMTHQHEFERILTDWATALDVRVQTGCEVVDVVAEDSVVRAVLADGRSLRAPYLVGCDGGRSVVRKRTGIAFPGTDATMTGRTAIVEFADPDAIPSSSRGPGGLLILSLVPGQVGTIEFDGGPDERDRPVTVEEMQASIRRVSGVDATITRMGAALRYSDNTRQAQTYRQGRVLLAGDAAHVHSPVGGQGLNLGLQDAMNLGWKLGLVARGLAPEAVLDTYTAERHPVGARVLRNTRAQIALMRPDAQSTAVREVVREALAVPATRQHFIAMVNGADVDYAPDAAHPAIGRFVPTLELAGADSLPVLLRDGRPVLLDLVDSPEIRAAAAGHADRIRVVTAHCPARDDVAALLVRPDGYVVWATAHADVTGLSEALATWFGAPGERGGDVAGRRVPAMGYAGS